MKTILLTSILLSPCMVIYAQKTTIPADIKRDFAKNHPAAANIKWDKEDQGYEASFEENKTGQSILYSASGNILETEIEIPLSALPAAAHAYLDKNYKDKKIKEAARITRQNGTVVYEAEINGKDILFDSNGTRLN